MSVRFTESPHMRCPCRGDHGSGEVFEGCPARQNRYDREPDVKVAKFWAYRIPHWVLGDRDGSAPRTTKGGPNWTTNAHRAVEFLNDDAVGRASIWMASLRWSVDMRVAARRIAAMASSPAGGINRRECGDDGIVIGMGHVQLK